MSVPDWGDRRQEGLAQVFSGLRRGEAGCDKVGESVGCHQDVLRCSPEDVGSHVAARMGWCGARVELIELLGKLLQGNAERTVLSEGGDRSPDIESYEIRIRGYCLKR